MNLTDLLWEIFSVVFVTAVVVFMTLYYQKKVRDREE